MNLFNSKHFVALVFLFALCLKAIAQIPTSYNIYQTPEDELATQISYLSSGHVFIAGDLQTNTISDRIFLKKTVEPSIGNQDIWQKVYDKPGVVEHLRDMEVTPDGKLLLLIEQRIDWALGGLNTANILLLKVDTEGEVIWEAFFNGGQKDIPVGIEVLLDGSCLLIGYSNSQTGSNFEDDLLWLKVAANGNIGSPKYITANAFISAPIEDLALSPDGSVYAMSNYQIVKFDADGNALWEKPMGENLSDRLLTELYIKQDGSLLIAGSATLSATPEALDAIIIHVTSEGEFLWQQTYGDEGIEIIEELIVCEEEGKIVCVGQDTPNDLVLVDGYYFLVTDMVGNQISSSTVGGDSPSWETGFDLAYASDGWIVTAGISSEFGSQDVMMLFPFQPVFSCSPQSMVNATEDTRLAHISISPNPTADDFTVTMDGTSLAKQPYFLLFDAVGKLILTAPLDKPENRFNGLNLAPGLYFYTINGEGMALGNGKLVVMGQ